MKILVVGSGGREHAICSAFAKSKRVERVYCANGNAGIGEVAELVLIRPDDIASLVDFASANSIGLTFVGGETSLALGIVDAFEAKGLRIIGVSKAAARLEASKAFAKDFMLRHNIPTARFNVVRSKPAAIDILRSGTYGDQSTPVVVKADGLAAGKGVVVATNRSEALAAIDELDNLAGADAASTIVLEECLFGREVSLILFCDGGNFELMPPTRDHKRIGEGDTGANTGGMGTITDATLLSDDAMADIIRTIIIPTLEGCRAEGFPFRGIMFLGLMMTQDGPKLLEYNVRFGDPETQAILIRLETDLVDICDAMLTGRLDEIEIRWLPGNSACVILASDGYPSKPRVGDVITGLDHLPATPDLTVFHSGTARNEVGKLITSGGRVLGITATADSLEGALAKAYHAANRISWPGMQYRRDIGK
ncbi:phosphoribosylamine--glycine ligase [soil metagenome]